MACSVASSLRPFLLPHKRSILGLGLGFPDHAAPEPSPSPLTLLPFRRGSSELRDKALTVGSVVATSLGRGEGGEISSSPWKESSWSSQRRQVMHANFQRGSRRTFVAFANANVSQGKRSSGDDIIMVDPLEAKRLAAKQMQEIQAKEKLERRRRAEAINGAWAMIGLTAGLVVEGQTGKGILGQLAGYWDAFTKLFVH
uniref:Uncharacterized protein n=1 Tax=Ananas comosus var. bracteatus TaxID=296719 RepID=A0A6V7PBD3_ANACO|nr:unnamed protein product [Ananas comosus var. bracteatus]